MRSSAALCTALAAGLFASVAVAQPLAVSVVIQEGQDLGDGLTVTTLGDPYTNSLGQVGVLYTRSDTVRGMWIGNASVWTSDLLLPDTVTGGEATIGISDAGDFIYSPNYNGEDSVVTSHGKLLIQEEPAPGMPGFFSSFNSRPRMSASGTAYWVGGFTSVQGGSTEGYVFWKAEDTANPAGVVPLMRTGDLIDGRPLSDSGVVFNFAVSDDGQQLLNSIDLDGPTADNTLMLLNLTTIVAREGQPTGDGDLWANFDDPAINNSGNYVFTGDTNSLTTSADGFIAYNGQIVLREGTVLDGVPLVGNAVDIAIDNTNRVLFTWNTQSSTNRTRTVFLGTAPDLASSTAILRLDQELDTNNDGIADYTVSGINPGTGPGVTFSENGPVYLSVELLPIGGGTALETIIAIDVGGGGCAVDWNDDGSVNSGDISSFLTAWIASVQAPDLVADFNNDGQTNSGDISSFLTAWIDAVTNGC